MNNHTEWVQFLSHYPMTSNDSINQLTDLSHFGLLKISGGDAKKFLQGQLTCHLDEVNPNHSRVGAHCNPKGRIISLFRVFFFHDSYYLQMPREMLTIAMSALKKYAVFFKVSLHDASDELIGIGYEGSSLKPIIENIPDTIDECITHSNFIIMRIAGPSPRFQLYGDFNSISLLWEQLTKTSQRVSMDEWKYKDICMLLPTIYPETSEKFLPHELNLHLNNGVSFNKGCYTGQEIIARMHYRGKLKTELKHIAFNTHFEPTRGLDLPNSSNTVVDYCKKSDNTFELLILSSDAGFQS